MNGGARPGDFRPPLEQELMLELAGNRVRAALLQPGQVRGALVLAHGRIHDLNHPSIMAASQGAARAGWASLRFNFPYRQRGEDLPDPFAVLLKTHEAAARWLLERFPGPEPRLVLGGKSQGSRTALTAAAHARTAGCIALGFPLHHPRKRDQLNALPLKQLRAPLLMVQGERDPVCRPDVLRRVLLELSAPVTLELIPQANHSFESPAFGKDENRRVAAAISGAVERFLLNLNREPGHKN